MRLYPLTKIISKALLTVYNKPLIMYPLQTLIDAGIEEVLIVTPGGKTYEFKNLLGDGKGFGINIKYIEQKEPKGMADAVRHGQKFVGNDNVVVIAADNIFNENFAKIFKAFDGGCQIFVDHVPDPERFGILKLGKNGQPLDLVEKPKKFISDMRVVAMYLYDNRVFDVIDTLKPSGRGELEITDINRWYLKNGDLKFQLLKRKNIDAGTFDALLEANNFIARKIKMAEKFGRKIL